MRLFHLQRNSRGPEFSFAKSGRGKGEEMGIKKEVVNLFWISCDECETKLHDPEYKISEAQEVIKNIGWQIKDKKVLCDECLKSKSQLLLEKNKV